MTDTTVDEFIEVFSDFSVTVDDQRTLDKLCSLLSKQQQFSTTCDVQKIVYDWIAFSKSKKIPQLPTTETLEHFEREILNKQGSKIHQKFASPITYTSQTINELLDADESEDVIVDAYCTPKSVSKKRQVPNEIGSRKRLVLSCRSPGLPFSPRSLASPASIPSEKYKSRVNAGEVLTNYGATDNIIWKQSQQKQLPVTNYNPGNTLTNCKYMFEKIYDKAQILSDQIQQMTTQFMECKLVEEFVHVTSGQQDTVSIAGRITCDGNGRLNVNSIILQGSREISYGRWIVLDVSAVPQYSLFPGQIVAVDGLITNSAKGRRFVVSKLHEGIMLPLSTKPALSQGDIRLVVASGPFTIGDNILYEPLNDLLTYLEGNPPDVCILFGPFVDVKMADSEKFETTDVTYDDIFKSVMNQIISRTQKLGISLVIIPSNRDAHHDFVYPQPPFNLKLKEDNNIYFMSDPCTVEVDGFVIGATSTDILFHMGAEEISSHTLDRFSRLAKHLLTQQSYYPLLPPGPDVNLDFELYKECGKLPVTPHLLLLPSDLRYFIKNVGESICINPGRLAKGQVGGSFARIVVKRPGNDESWSSSVAAEILRI